MSFAVAARRIAGLLLLLGGAHLIPLHASAQSTAESDVSLSVGGIIQAETSYGVLGETSANEGRARVGFGLRRTRLLATARLGPKFGAHIHLDADNGTFGVLDAFVSYQANPRVRLRLGRMASAQPRAFILTPVVAMDTNERAAIALLWHAGTLGSKGRDFGVDLRYLDGPLELLLFVHNGDGHFDVLRGNYQPGILGDVTAGADRGLGDMAVSAFVAIRPEGVTGLEIGGYAGYNGSQNPSTALGGVGRTYGSYSAHAYWGAEPGSQPIRLKADLIGVRYEELETVPAQHTLGLSFLGAVAVHEATELFGRVEMYDAGLDGVEGGDIFFAAGLSFSPSQLRGRPFAQERLTLAYNGRFPEADFSPTRHLLVLQLQLRF